jgi:hypothetical protein
MRNRLLAAGAALTLIGGAAHATTVADPTGDFLPSFVGAHDADLDVTSFGVTWDPGKAAFLLQATFAGAIDPGKAGFYVIGVNTGTGAIKPFASIGEPKVIFNQAIVIQKSGAGAVSGHNVAATIAGDSFSAWVPVSFLPSTGFSPGQYGFNLWPRNTGPGLGSISDFAPQNATVTGVPEPTTWALALAGFALMGVALRRQRRGVSITA